jgi:hypothetical protein
MLVEIDPELESRLEPLAKRRQVTVAQLIGGVLTRFLETLGDDPSQWVQVTEQQIGRVWPREDFSAWEPPRAD